MASWVPNDQPGSSGGNLQPHWATGTGHPANPQTVAPDNPPYARPPSAVHQFQTLGPLHHHPRNAAQSPLPGQGAPPTSSNRMTHGNPFALYQNEQPLVAESQGFQAQPGAVNAFAPPPSRPSMRNGTAATSHLPLGHTAPAISNGPADSVVPAHPGAHRPPQARFQQPVQHGHQGGVNSPFYSWNPTSASPSLHHRSPYIGDQGTSSSTMGQWPPINPHGPSDHFGPPEKLPLPPSFPTQQHLPTFVSQGQSAVSSAGNPSSAPWTHPDVFNKGNGQFTPAQTSQSLAMVAAAGPRPNTQVPYPVSQEAVGAHVGTLPKGTAYGARPVPARPPTCGVPLSGVQMIPSTPPSYFRGPQANQYVGVQRSCVMSPTSDQWWSQCHSVAASPALSAISISSAAKKNVKYQEFWAKVRSAKGPGPRPTKTSMRGLSPSLGPAPSEGQENKPREAQAASDQSPRVTPRVTCTNVRPEQPTEDGPRSVYTSTAEPAKVVEHDVNQAQPDEQLCDRNTRASESRSDRTSAPASASDGGVASAGLHTVDQKISGDTTQPQPSTKPTESREGVLARDHWLPASHERDGGALSVSLNDHPNGFFQAGVGSQATAEDWAPHTGQLGESHVGLQRLDGTGPKGSVEERRIPEEEVQGTNVSSSMPTEGPKAFVGTTHSLPADVDTPASNNVLQTNLTAETSEVLPAQVHNHPLYPLHEPKATAYPSGTPVREPHTENSIPRRDSNHETKQAPGVRAEKRCTSSVHSEGFPEDVLEECRPPSQRESLEAAHSRSKPDGLAVETNHDLPSEDRNIVARGDRRRQGYVGDKLPQSAAPPQQDSLTAPKVPSPQHEIQTSSSSSHKGQEQRLEPAAMASIFTHSQVRRSSRPSASMFDVMRPVGRGPIGGTGVEAAGNTTNTQPAAPMLSQNSQPKSLDTNARVSSTIATSGTPISRADPPANVADGRYTVGDLSCLVVSGNSQTVTRTSETFTRASDPASWSPDNTTGPVGRSEAWDGRSGRRQSRILAQKDVTQYPAPATTFDPIAGGDVPTSPIRDLQISLVSAQACPETLQNTTFVEQRPITASHEDAVCPPHAEKLLKGSSPEPALEVDTVSFPKGPPSYSQREIADSVKERGPQFAGNPRIAGTGVTLGQNHGGISWAMPARRLPSTAPTTPSTDETALAKFSSVYPKRRSMSIVKEQNADEKSDEVSPARLGEAARALGPSTGVIGQVAQDQQSPKGPLARADLSRPGHSPAQAADASASLSLSPVGSPAHRSGSGGARSPANPSKAIGSETPQVMSGDNMNQRVRLPLPANLGDRVRADLPDCHPQPHDNPETFPKWITMSRVSDPEESTISAETRSPDDSLREREVSMGDRLPRLTAGTSRDCHGQIPLTPLQSDKESRSNSTAQVGKGPLDSTPCASFSDLKRRRRSCVPLACFTKRGFLTYHPAWTSGGVPLVILKSRDPSSVFSGPREEDYLSLMNRWSFVGPVVDSASFESDDYNPEEHLKRRISSAATEIPFESNDMILVMRVLMRFVGWEETYETSPLSLIRCETTSLPSEASSMDTGERHHSAEVGPRTFHDIVLRCLRQELVKLVKWDTLSSREEKINTIIYNELLNGNRQQAASIAGMNCMPGEAEVLSLLEDEELWTGIRAERAKWFDEAMLGAVIGITSAHRTEKLVRFNEWALKTLYTLLYVVDYNTFSPEIAITMREVIRRNTDNWIPVLVLILANRTEGDLLAIELLGDVLRSYRRPWAASLCYLLARKCFGLGGPGQEHTKHVAIGSSGEGSTAVAHGILPFLVTEVFEGFLQLQLNAMTRELRLGSAERLCDVAVLFDPTTMCYFQALKTLMAYSMSDIGYFDAARKYCDSVHRFMQWYSDVMPTWSSSVDTLFPAADSTCDTARRLTEVGDFFSRSLQPANETLMHYLAIGRPQPALDERLVPVAGDRKGQCPSPIEGIPVKASLPIDSGAGLEPCKNPSLLDSECRGAATDSPGAKDGSPFLSRKLSGVSHSSYMESSLAESGRRSRSGSFNACEVGLSVAGPEVPMERTSSDHQDSPFPELSVAAPPSQETENDTQVISRGKNLIGYGYQSTSQTSSISRIPGSTEMGSTDSDNSLSSISKRPTIRPIPSADARDSDSGDEATQASDPDRVQDVKDGPKGPWLLGQLFSRSRRKDIGPDDGSEGKPIKMNLGLDENPMYYDKEHKKWIDKRKPLEEQLKPEGPLPPPPMASPSAASSRSGSPAARQNSQPLPDVDRTSTPSPASGSPMRLARRGKARYVDVMKGMSPAESLSISQNVPGTQQGSLNSSLILPPANSLANRTSVAPMAQKSPVEGTDLHHPGNPRNKPRSLLVPSRESTASYEAPVDFGAIYGAADVSLGGTKDGEHSNDKAIRKDTTSCS